MKKNSLVLLALAGVMALSLTACSQPDAGESSPAPTDGNTDAVTTASVTTGLYGNLTQQELLDAIAAYSGVSVVSTVNADGTPNVAIFTPGAAGDDRSHIVFGFADNATKTNLLRDKVAEMVFDIPNASADTKEERHQGAVVKLELEEDADVLADLMANDRAHHREFRGLPHCGSAARGLSLTVKTESPPPLSGISRHRGGFFLPCLRPVIYWYGGFDYELLFRQPKFQPSVLSLVHGHGVSRSRPYRTGRGTWPAGRHRSNGTHRPHRC